MPTNTSEEATSENPNNTIIHSITAAAPCSLIALAQTPEYTSLLDNCSRGSADNSHSGSEGKSYVTSSGTNPSTSTSVCGSASGSRS
jgi:hypothetical protein